MKRKRFCIFLCAEAVASVLLYLARQSLPRAFSAVVAFPFEQLALGLRALSCRSRAGDAAAWVIYCAVCLLPLALLPVIRRRRRLQAEDALLAVLSAALFAVLYWMINPALLGEFMGAEEGRRVLMGVLGGVIYSVLVGYLLLRVLRRMAAADTQRLHRALAVLLYLLGAVFVFTAFGVCFGELLSSLDALRERNTEPPAISYVFLALQYFVDALPYVLDAVVTLAGLRLLQELGAERYSEQAVQAAERLSLLCGRALAATMLCTMSFNLLQLVFLRRLRDVSAHVQLPLSSVAFVLAALLLARYIRENKQLKDDNDLFV